jgi:hypothetical protein
VYNRRINDLELHFENSGGLIHSALVIQDQETNTYWTLMSGKAIKGKLKGTPLVELPIGSKMTWKSWRTLHPHTLVLSVKNQEHVVANPYRQYFRSVEGYRQEKASDKRLPTKTMVFAFRYQNSPYAIEHRLLENGRAVSLEGINLFFYRSQGAPSLQSTIAFQSGAEGFLNVDNQWIDKATQASFNPLNLRFENSSEGPERMKGFDCYWYTWSLNNPDTRLLE